MIKLTEQEKQWIRLCKGHLKNEYPFTGNWIKTIKPMFIEIYGWDPNQDNNYESYLNCLFEKLFEIYMKIKNDKSGTNLQLRQLFHCSFNKGIYVYNQELPIERAICRLCGMIQNNTVFEAGFERYNLK